MGIATPNRIADPVQLEQYVDPAIIRQMGGIFLDWYNESTTLSQLIGEPLVFNLRVWLPQKVTLPQKYGTIVSDWVADFLLNPAHTGDINQGDLIYWNTALDAVTAYSGGSAIAGVGAATPTLPTNGFILGHAVGNREIDLGVDGSNDLLAGKTGSKYVRVVSLGGPTTVYSA